jgi:hypothetical protein
MVVKNLIQPRELELLLLVRENLLEIGNLVGHQENHQDALPDWLSFPRPDHTPMLPQDVQVEDVLAKNLTDP